jgi:apolipoprotein N-acyltransferase
MRSLFGNLHTPSTFAPLSGLPPRRGSVMASLFWLLTCGLGGWLQAASLAWPLPSWHPLGLTPGEPSGTLQLAAMVLLVLALQQSSRMGMAAWRGWVFATAWLAGTFWWLFVSMHTYGGLAAWLAAAAVLALAGALSLYYAAAMGVLALLAPRARWAQAVLFAALWTLAELMRAQWFTGFPWGAVGYAHVDTLGAWAPWVGVYGMGAIAAMLAFGLGSAITALLRGAHRWLTRPVGLNPPTRRGPSASRSDRLAWLGALGQPLRVALMVLVLAALWWGGRWLPDGQRSTAGTGALRVWLLQGNIAQDEKFVAGTGMAQALAWYPEQIAQAVAAAAADPGQGPQLVVAPETAVPLLPSQLGPDFWPPLLNALAQPGADSPVAALIGLPLGSYTAGYTNSAWGLDAVTAASVRTRPSQDGAGTNPLPDDAFYRYDKHHLVPFGEFIPPLFRWFTELMNIPLGDFSRGALPQPAWSVAGQRVAPNICYEDLFGEELAASFRAPDVAPTVLINLSNIAWFGDTVAIDQHLQISRLRTLELGRPMLRATNTGATAVIDHRGEVTHALPRLTRDRLVASVEGRSGTTPFARWAARWGLTPVWVTCLTLVLLMGSMRRRVKRRR